MLLTEPQLICDYCMETIEQQTLVTLVYAGIFAEIDNNDITFDPEATLEPQTVTEHHYHYNCYSEYVSGKPRRGDKNG